MIRLPLIAATTKLTRPARSSAQPNTGPGFVSFQPPQMLRLLGRNPIDCRAMKSLVDPPTLTRPSTRDPAQPRTLSSALEKIDTLQSRIKQLEQAQSKTAAAPPVKTVSAASTLAAPTRQGIVADRTANQKLPEKLALPASATTPFLAGEIIKVTPTDSLRRMLDCETIPWRKSCLYQEIKAREQLSTY
jgi:hypothetical protein